LALSAIVAWDATVFEDEEVAEITAINTEARRRGGRTEKNFKNNLKAA
jgi:hypothetical protein